MTVGPEQVGVDGLQEPPTLPRWLRALLRLLVALRGRS